MATPQEQVAAELAVAAASEPQFPDGRFAGRGIVMCAGGARFFTCAWVCISLLRRELGCTLPIEVWHLGPEEMGPPMRALLDELGAHPVDALEVAKQHPVERLGGWELKAYALLHSRFSEVLLLDADNVPVKDPAYLFDRPEFRDTGALFWPDIVRISRDNPIWALSGLAWEDMPAFESGQLVVDKAKCWRALHLAHWINQRSGNFYNFLYGDKDTFLIAWRFLRRPFHLVRHQPKLLDFTLCQRDPDGALLFQHRNSAKWILDGDNPRIEGFQRQEKCLELLQELAALWDGRIFNPPPRSEQARRIEHGLAHTRDFRYVRVSSDERDLQLLSGHRIGRGATRAELYWHVEDGAEGPTLILGSGRQRSCALRCSPDGVWQGRALAKPCMPIELVPQPAANPAVKFATESTILDLLLDRILELYESLPLDSETCRDLVGTIRTLAILDADLLERLQREAVAGNSSRLRTDVVALALDGLASSAQRPDRGGVAPGNSGIGQVFAAKGYERVA
jgi:hypothetical protein